MATIVSGGRVKLNNGTVVNATNGAWYDAAQYWDGSLGNPGEFNSKNNQPGQQGQAAATPTDQTFINQQRQQQSLPTFTYSNPTPSPSASANPGYSPSSSSTTPSAPLNIPNITQPNIDLPGLYDKLVAGSGISETQLKLDEYDKRLADAQGSINDNPFLSEATRTGRIAKLKTQYDSETAPLINRIEGARADVQVKLNLASQQYNIADQQYQRTVSLYSNLLASGALNSASPEDIGKIAVATGLSSSMVASVIGESKKSKEVKPTLVTVDDGVHQKIVAVDQYGNALHEQILGASTKTTATGNTNSTLDNQKLYDKYDTQVQKIISEADVMNQKGNAKKSDKLLASYEQESALQQIMATLGVSREIAYDILDKGMRAGGYGNWTQ